MTDEQIDFACHIVALLLLTGFAWFFGCIVATAYGPIAGNIAGGFLCLSMTTRYAVNMTDEPGAGGTEP